MKVLHQTSLNTTDLMMLTALVLILLLSPWSVQTRQMVPVIDAAPIAAVNTAASEPAETTIIVAVAAMNPPQASTMPDFSAIRNVQLKKQKFFSYLLPKIREANDRIRVNRKYLLQVRDDLRSGDRVTERDIQIITDLAKRYRLKGESSLSETVDALLVRVDVVPESLVLAQAANESGWGTSRFAREGNNLFGVWCFRKGCGLAPLNRDEGLSHEVARYASVQHSIAAYMHTINTNPAYTELREIRATTRSGEQPFTGLVLAEGLVRYSSRGADYVREIQHMIRTNNLQQYTLPLKV